MGRRVIPEISLFFLYRKEKKEGKGISLGWGGITFLGLSLLVKWV